MTDHQAPSVLPLPVFAPWREAHQLYKAGYRNEALVYIISEVSHLHPTDDELLALRDPEDEEMCVLTLGQKLIWGRVPKSTGELLVRLLHDGQLAPHFYAFTPTDPEVLTGLQAELLPDLPDRQLGAMPTARWQSKGGFNALHWISAGLVVGPNADLARIRQLLADLTAPDADCPTKG